MPDRTPTSPRAVVIDVNSPQINRSIPTSSPNVLTPSRSIGPPSMSHRGSVSRKHRPANDADARERQTQQDIESAMSMCRYPYTSSVAVDLIG